MDSRLCCITKNKGVNGILEQSAIPWRGENKQTNKQANEKASKQTEIEQKVNEYSYVHKPPRRPKMLQNI